MKNTNKNRLYGTGMDGKTGIELEPPHEAADRYMVGPLEELPLTFHYMSCIVLM